MKNIIRTFAILFCLLNYSCRAQQMVQVPDDAMKLKINEQQFINKPLKDLLKEIKPEIKFVNGTIDFPSFLSFRFINSQELKQERKGRKLTAIYVYVKEPLDWDFNKRPKGKEFDWTNEDVKKYENLTVTRIKVISRIED